MQYIGTINGPVKIDVHVDKNENHLSLVFFKEGGYGIWEDAMAVVEFVYEDNQLVAKVFDEEQIGNTVSSAMYTLVDDINQWKPKEEE